MEVSGFCSMLEYFEFLSVICKSKTFFSYSYSLLCFRITWRPCKATDSRVHPQAKSFFFSESRAVVLNLECTSESSSEF